MHAGKPPRTRFFTKYRQCKRKKVWIQVPVYHTEADPSLPDRCARLPLVPIHGAVARQLPSMPGPACTRNTLSG